ncbi:MAG: hypothetical protein AABZ15_06615 [Nitrospirota bacterium]
MLKEILDVRQVPGDARRRVFFSGELDLTVWLDERDGILGFELCYDKGKNERAVRWSREAGFLHQKVDDGENRPGRYKSTPILVPDGMFPAKKISRLFQDSSRDMDRSIAEFICRKLLEYPQ